MTRDEGAQGAGQEVSAPETPHHDEAARGTGIPQKGKAAVIVLTTVLLLILFTAYASIHWDEMHASPLEAPAGIAEVYEEMPKVLAYGDAEYVVDLIKIAMEDVRPIYGVPARPPAILGGVDAEYCYQLDDDGVLWFACDGGWIMEMRVVYDCHSLDAYAEDMGYFNLNTAQATGIYSMLVAYINGDCEDERVSDFTGNLLNDYYEMIHQKFTSAPKPQSDYSLQRYFEGNTYNMRLVVDDSGEIWAVFTVLAPRQMEI